MNVSSGHKGMNGNKSQRRFLGLAFCLLALNGTTARAQDHILPSTPALADVKEIVVQSPRITTTLATKQCDVKPEEMQGFLVKALRNYGLPAFSLLEAKPARMDMARVELHTEIVTSNSVSGECTSWISISVQTHNTLRIPPVDTPRSVIVTYWRGGLMVNSVELTHERVIAGSLEKLGRQLATQFRLDQPPPMPTFDDEKTLEDILPSK